MTILGKIGKIMAEKADAPYQVVKSTVGRATGFFTLVDTRNNNIINYDEDKEYLESERNRLNTDWFFRTYVGM